ncbi:MAG: copper-binding protein [Roseiarcus sp.]|jgi:Cu/Ag efflux protein CusF
MNKMRICARIAAALMAVAISAAGADALPFVDRSLAERTSAAVAPAQAQQGEPEGIFRGVGVVKAIDAATGALTLNHEDIKGLMPAMEMMYRVDPRSLSEGLRPGDRIDFGLDAKTYTVRDVKLIERAK